MKVFACITIALCVALASAEETAKVKRYAALLPHGIESKLSFSSIPQSFDYSNNLQRIYSGYSPNLAYSGNYGTPYLSSGLYGLQGLAQSSFTSIPSAYSGLDASYGSHYGASLGTTYGTPQVFQGPIKEGGATQNVQVRTITQQVPVAVPQPYPVEVTKPVSVPQPYPVDVPKPVPVPVKVEVPVEVPRPYPVRVAQPVPVQVPVKVPVEIPRPYPVTVTKTVPVPVEKPVYVKYPVQYSVPVPAPYPVEVPHPVPVSVPHPVVVKEPQVHVTKSTAYVQPTIRTFSTIQPVSYTAGLNNFGVYSPVQTYAPSTYSSGSVYAGPYSQAVLDSHLYSHPTSYVQGKYLTSAKQYINTQPLSYVSSSYDNKYGGLLKSYVPSTYGGYNGLKTYSSVKSYAPTAFASLKSYAPTAYGTYSSVKSYSPNVYTGYNGLKSYTSEYLQKK